MPLSPLNLLHCDSAILNSGLVSLIRGSSKLIVIERNLEEATAVRKAIALLRQAIGSSPGKMRFDDSFETDMDMMVERMND
ncbi:hypothetical protein Tco_0219884 [Tanacetum coccineum]